MEEPQTRYLEHDGINIAWQVFGEGPAEIMIVPGWVSNVDQFWIYPDPREFLAELGGFARVAMYDKPGTGASDPLEATPSVELRVEQVVAVMDAAGLGEATVIGVSEGGITAALAAAGRPDRVGRLVLLNAVSGGFDPRSRGEMSEAEFEEWCEFILSTAEHWGEGLHGDRWLAGVPDGDAAWGRLQRACATPAVARRYMGAVADGLSAWDVLEAIHQPALVMQRRSDRIVRAELARAEAERIPNARYVELEGEEHLPWLGETGEMLAQLREFVGAPAPAARSERVLATVLFTDIVGSTEALARLGDAAWREKLERHTRIVGEGMERFDGHLVKSTGDGALATFTGPARGAEAARWILDALEAEGLRSRAGLHVGEIEMQNGDIAGLAVHIAARVMDTAGDGEVLVSRTVRDLTAGSELRFDERGTHTLKGVPEDWQLYALAG
ncbi:MAG: adenylate/guanylate cyclase domain-containing protein [Solirubrobacterales bacterium]